MASNIQDDPLFLSRSEKGQRVNFIYHREYDRPKLETEEAAWFEKSEADKFSSIYCANAMHFRERSFRPDEREGHAICDVEHRRWMLSVLILGFAPVERAKREEWKARMASKETEEAAKKEKKQLKDAFIHMDITPYEDLPEGEKVKDRIIIDRIPYILHGDPSCRPV